jgi:uncharacterized protein
MIHVVIDSVRQSILTRHFIGVLKEADGERFLIVWLLDEPAVMLAMTLKKVKHPRPLTYDFFVRMLHETNLSVERVFFHRVIDRVARAQVVVARRGALGRTRATVECSPSDALLTAAHFEVPIYVAPAVLEQLGTTRDNLPTKDMDDKVWGVKPKAAKETAT